MRNTGITPGHEVHRSGKNRVCQIRANEAARQRTVVTAEGIRRARPQGAFEKGFAKLLTNRLYGNSVHGGQRNRDVLWSLGRQFAVTANRSLRSVWRLRG